MTPDPFYIFLNSLPISSLTSCLLYTQTISFERYRLQELKYKGGALCIVGRRKLRPCVQFPGFLACSLGSNPEE